MTKATAKLNDDITWLLMFVWFMGFFCIVGLRFSVFSAFHLVVFDFCSISCFILDVFFLSSGWLGSSSSLHHFLTALMSCPWFSFCLRIHLFVRHGLIQSFKNHLTFPQTALHCSWFWLMSEDFLCAEPPLPVWSGLNTTYLVSSCYIKSYQTNH